MTAENSKTQWSWRNRYGQERITTKTGENTFTIEGSSAFIRSAWMENEPGVIDFVDFEGGPFICVRSSMWEYGVTGADFERVVKSVAVTTLGAEDELRTNDWTRVEVTVI
tara:strand:- start:1061 stop:1390 length:330 start_codon:yes stop_codon:yes gene_type:complete